jgi:enediyne biosynthesis protein E4
MDRREFLAALFSLECAGRSAFAQAPSTPRLPVFRDVTAKSRIDFHCQGSPTSEKYLIETMPGGVAMFDYDGDGYLDLYFVNGAKLDDPMPPGKTPDKSEPRYWNRLYRNNRDGTFTDVTEKAGVRGNFYGMGGATGDYDNDGHQDLYVTNFGSNILYHNNGDGTFTDVTGKAGVAGGGWSSSACFVDYDNDGWLDLIVTRYMKWDFPMNIWCGPREPGYRGYCHPESFPKSTHLVYHNNRDGTFTDVSKECGIGTVPGYGLGISFNDYDGDGRADILIANDNVPEQLFHNLGEGKFRDVALKLGLAYDDDGRTFSGMGVDFNDYDNDGWPDVVIGTLAREKYALFHNRKGTFEYASERSGVARITALHSGWGLKLVDYDNDGWKDLFVAQGHVMDNIGLSSPSLRYLEPMLLLRNKRGIFEDVSPQSGEALATPRASRGVAFGDLDNDGFVDIAVNCLNGPAVILRNEGGNGNHWLLVDTVGTISNRDGIGARVRVTGESGMEQVGIVSAAGSYQSANDKRVHFGLGADKVAKTVEIFWPSGKQQKLENVKADQILTIKEPGG